MILVHWHLIKDGPAPVLERSDYEIIALHNFFKLFDHGFSMRLSIALVVLEEVDVIRIASTIDFHGLEE